jgi:hypothetical protein
MSQPDRLYELLPAVYRQRDAEQGFPLRALLQVIAEQVDVVEADIARLYENWFIETSEDWVVPYLGDLIGYRQVHEAGEPGDPRVPKARALNKILIPRREMANTIRYRRRKGAVALLELLANDVAGWPARAVEFYKLLGWTQHLNHQRPHRGRTAGLRDADMLDTLDGPFDQLAHTVDVRRINSHRTMGRYDIPSVGVFVWRLKSYSVGWTNAQGNEWKSPLGTTAASCIEEEGPHCYTFSVLGNDTPLYNRPQPETDPTHIAGELNLPTPIRRRAFAKPFAGGKPGEMEASDLYYGVRKSVSIWAPGWPKKGAEQPIPAKLIVPADLRGWHYHAPSNRVAVDPATGRIVFPTTKLPKQGVRVVYHYGFSADIGGGEYQRLLSQPAGAKLYRVAQGTAPGKEGWFDSVKAALDQWARDKETSSQPAAEIPEPRPVSAVIEIADSAVYTDPLNLQLQANESLQVRAANRTRPVIRLLDYMADMPDALSISGDTGSRVILDGLLITGRGLQVSGPEIDSDNPGVQGPGDLCAVTIRHCTLVPGWALHCDCEPKRETEPSLTLLNTSAHVRIEHSIIGAVEVTAAEETRDPVPIDVSDTIWDATSEEREALSGPDDEIAYASLRIARSTVLGKVLAHAIPLAENSIFTALVQVARRQNGCMRFCYVPPDSRTPRRYECQPDLVDRSIEEKLPPGSERDLARDNERLRVEPAFNSTRYGTPTYCQLAETCADEITRGADDESEMGAFHDLYQPQRAANLRARLGEFTPAGMDAGVIYVT